MKKKKIKKKKMTLDELNEKGRELNEIHRCLREEGVVGDGFHEFRHNTYHAIKDCKDKGALKKYDSAYNNLSVAITRYEKSVLNVMVIIECEYATMEDKLMDEEE